MICKINKYDFMGKKFPIFLNITIILKSIRRNCVIIIHILLTQFLVTTYFQNINIVDIRWMDSAASV